MPADPAKWEEPGVADLLSGKHEPYHVKLARMTLDERVADEISRSKPVCLRGKVPSGRTGGGRTCTPKSPS